MICLLSTGPSMIRPAKKFWKSQKKILIFSFLPPDFYHFSSNLKGKTIEFLERWKSNTHSSCLFVFKIRSSRFFCLFAYLLIMLPSFFPFLPIPKPNLLFFFRKPKPKLLWPFCPKNPNLSYSLRSALSGWNYIDAFFSAMDIPRKKNEI